MSDLVNHPSHYEEQSIKLEPIDFCERLPFCEGNAIKYCFRAGHKDGASELLDLKKAQWYLNRRRTSNTALRMSDQQFDTFKEFTWYLKRSNGVLKAAVCFITTVDFGKRWKIVLTSVSRSSRLTKPFTTKR